MTDGRGAGGTLRSVVAVSAGSAPYMVGDGFRVRNLLPTVARGDHSATSPFLLLDYHAPYAYPPSAVPRGVGVHPHRGFETVTLAFEGTVAHHDSGGNSGVIGPGDIQWMTAGSGVLHKEYHEAGFAAAGGTMHMVQLWVNLPRAHKMTPPRYQAIASAAVPEVELPAMSGRVRVIAGQFAGREGAATTFTPVDLLDVRLEESGRLLFGRERTHNVAILILEGSADANGSEAAAGDIVLFGRDGEVVDLQARKASRLLLLAGEPIAEPVVQQGPFVMNSIQEVRQAFSDYQSGRFGHLAE